MTKLILAGVSILILVIGFKCVQWKASRTINYNLHYKTHVEKTIRDMVKQDALK